MWEILRWVATATGTVAAVMVASNAGARITGWGFVVFAFSSVLWALTGWVEGMGSLLVQNGVLFAINLFGIYRWLWLSREVREHIIEARPGRPAVAGVTAVLPRRSARRRPDGRADGPGRPG